MKPSIDIFKKILCVTLCASVAFLSGCWSRKEPRSLAFVSSALYDIRDDNYRITLEIINPASQGTSGAQSGQSPSVIVLGESKSIVEGIRDTSKHLEKSVFSGHVKVRFVSEAFAKDKVKYLTDTTMRSYQLDENPLLIVIKGDNPEMVYTCKTELSDTVGEYIDGLQNSQPNFLSNSVFQDIHDFIKDSYTDGKQPVCGTIEIMEDPAVSKDNKPDSANSRGREDEGAEQDSQNSSGEKNSKKDSGEDKKYIIKYEGLAAFKDDKLVGFMDGTETRAYNFITNNFKSGNISIQGDYDKISFVLNKTKSKIKTNIDGENITVDIEVRSKMYITLNDGTYKLGKREDLKKIEEIFNKQAEDEMALAIKKAQKEFQSDIFGFGREIHMQHPKEWEKLKDDWDSTFSNITVNVKMNSSVTLNGQREGIFE